MHIWSSKVSWRHLPAVPLELTIKGPGPASTLPTDHPAFQLPLQVHQFIKTMIPPLPILFRVSVSARHAGNSIFFPQERPTSGYRERIPRTLRQYPLRPPPPGGDCSRARCKMHDYERNVTPAKVKVTPPTIRQEIRRFLRVPHCSEQPGETVDYLQGLSRLPPVAPWEA